MSAETNSRLVNVAAVVQCVHSASYQESEMWHLCDVTWVTSHNTKTLEPIPAVIRSLGAHLVHKYQHNVTKGGDAFSLLEKWTCFGVEMQISPVTTAKNLTKAAEETSTKVSVSTVKQIL